MKPIFFFLLSLFLPLSAWPQLVDNFSDGDFTNNPEWLGQTDRFTVNTGELQLNDPNPGSANTSYLYTPAATTTNALTTWEVGVRLEFSPSTSNFARIYLLASQTDLNGAQEGYFLKIGGISGSEDALELYRQDGSNTTLLISGTPGSLGTDPAQANIQVTRTPQGEWQLLADYSGGNNYQLEGTATDLTYTFGNYFGFYCRYTSTRNTAFFFDNVSVDPLFADQTPPQLLEVSVLTPTSLSVRFDEPVTTATANQSTNYFLNNGIGNPLTAQVNAQDPSEVILTLGTPLTNLQTYELEVMNIADLAGNVLTTGNFSFTYFDIGQPNPNDLIITEIMADPNPSVGLPVAEYVELYNNSESAFQLEGVGFSTGGTPKLLASQLLLPGEYLILTDEDAVAEFAAFGPTLGMAGFPALTNGGDELALLDTEGNEIFVLAYTDQWYQDESKADGGWSLELLGLDGPYACSGNWRASVDPFGGTPGTVNSVNGLTPDQTPPRLLAAYAESDLEVMLVFDEELDLNTTTDAALYRIDPNTVVQAAFPQIPEQNQVLLTLQNPLEMGVVYTVTVVGGLTDCLGNSIASPDNTARLGLSEPIDTGDLVINEILFYPESGGHDFVELYNRSDKVIDLRGIRIQNTQSSSSNSSTVIQANHLIFPGAYAVLTEDINDLQNRYTVEVPHALLETDLPSFSSDAGNVSIFGPGNVPLDIFDYRDELHSALLDDDRGVSLERLSPDKPTQSDGNWHSAAAAAGFATPTYQNSQYFVRDTMAATVFNLPNNRFSPDGDGFEDVLLIDYQTDRAGYLANVSIFDAQGRLVRRLVSNELLATEGTIKWDGQTNENSKARIGIYVIWFELFDPEGQVDRMKEVCVVAGQL